MGKTITREEAQKVYEYNDGLIKTEYCKKEKIGPLYGGHYILDTNCKNPFGLPIWLGFRCIDSFYIIEHAKKIQEPTWVLIECTELKKVCKEYVPGINKINFNKFLER